MSQAKDWISKTDMMKSERKIHFIGIGGIGMSAIARILNFLGHQVRGSDEKENSIIRDMRNEGIKCFVGHRKENLGDCDIVVYSSSIGEDNAELCSAREKGLHIVHRARMLAKTMEGKRSVAITGAHGKTTTTAVTALIFQKAGKRPMAAIGGEVVNFKSNALLGVGDFFVFEADESDGSFLNFYPDIAVLLNIDREHFDYFKNMENAFKIYGRFIGNVKSGGTVYYNRDDRNVAQLMKKYNRRKVSFGIDSDAELRAIEIKQSGLTIHFKVAAENRVLPDEFIFPMPGRHNVTNALAAIVVARDAGIDPKIIREALACYKGTKRRFEIKSTANGMMVVEDYAHHPNEIRAVLRACESLNTRPIVVFQPHRYTRTKDLFEEFINCFDDAKYIILTDIYAAAERAIGGVSTENLFLEMKRRGMRNVEYIKKDAVGRRVMEVAKRGDAILILGAGDINEVAKELATKMNDSRESERLLAGAT